MSRALDWGPGVILTLTSLVLVQSDAASWSVLIVALCADFCLGIACMHTLRRLR